MSGNKYSRFEFYKFFACSSDCNFGSAAIYIRFRFISDATPDTLAGWMIDSIKIEHEAFESISKLSKLQSLKAFPNPSYDGAYTFPALEEEKSFNIEVYNTLGQRIHRTPYMHSILFARCPAGLYFYRVTNGADLYQGQLIKE